MSRQPEEIEDRIEDLSRRFIAMCVGQWQQRGLAAELLAPALLAHAVNLMIATDGADETAAVLSGLATEISQPKAAGHA